MDDRRNKIIVGVVIAIVVIGVVALIVVKKSSPSCELVDSLPALDATKLHNISSQDNFALANFAGYLKYELGPDVKGDEAKRVYMPLSLQSVNLEAEDSGSVLTLTEDCAKLSLSLKKSGDGKVNLADIQVDLTGQPSRNEKVCRVSPGIVISAGKHYSCKKEVSYDCVAQYKDDKGVEKTKTVAHLVVSSIEFEINGDPEKIKKQTFSTEAEPCK